MTVVARTETASKNTPAAAISVAEAAAATATVATNDTILSERALTRTGQIVGVVSAIVALIVLPMGGFYVTQQKQTAYLDTLIQERGARNIETRQMVVDLQRDFQTEKSINAGFRERMDQRTADIVQMLHDEREDRKEIKPR